jgi:phosphomannomutase
VTIFRAYDVRGVYGTELAEEEAGQIGKAFGSYIGEGKAALGRDTRISGPPLQKAFLEGVLGTGASLESYGVIPISILSYVTWADHLKGAAYISASHNPPEYNGIRFRTGEGYGLLYQDTEIMSFYRQGRFRSGTGTLRENKAQEAVQRYASYVEEKLDLRCQLRIVLDMGNGSACIAGPVYERLGLQPIPLNGTMDGLFPGRGPSPTESSLKEAAALVVKSGADYGVGFDPDADRGLVIDGRGRVLPPEKVAIILAKSRYKPGDSIISGFDCSMVLERILEPEGFKVKRERVGDVFVANRVKSSGAVLGVERSGHFFLPEFQYSDDPFAMSLALGEVIAGGQRLSELADQIPDYPYLQISIRLREDPSGVMKILQERLARMEPETTDGLKVTAEGYSVLIRPSNTEPLIRLYVETTGEDPRELAARYVAMIKGAMRS